MYIGVIGPAEATPGQYAWAEEVGRLLAEQGHVVVCGGLGGVMEAASLGATVAGGLTVGLLPGAQREAANPFLTVALSTGMGEMRNALLVRVCDALICVAGSWGTLSEVALAVRTGVPVVMLGGWDLPDGPRRAASPQEAVRLATAG